MWCLRTSFFLRGWTKFPFFVLTASPYIVLIPFACSRAQRERNSPLSLFDFLLSFKIHDRGCCYSCQDAPCESLFLLCFPESKRNPHSFSLLSGFPLSRAVFCFYHPFFTPPILFRAYLIRPLFLLGGPPVGRKTSPWLPITRRSLFFCGGGVGAPFPWARGYFSFPRTGGDPSSFFVDRRLLFFICSSLPLFQSGYCSW